MKKVDKTMCALAISILLLTPSFVNSMPMIGLYSDFGNPTYIPDLEIISSMPKPSAGTPKIGEVIEGHNMVWGESVGWVNLRATHAELKVGSNILAGWIWLESCGWVCLGDGHPMNKERYSNRSACDWGINADGKGMLSGFAWSEATGWINFRSSHSRVYIDRGGQLYGYAWGENVGWVHFGPSGNGSYLAKVDAGPWEEIGHEVDGKLAKSEHDHGAVRGGYIPAVGIKNESGRYKTDANTACVIRLGRDDLKEYNRSHDKQLCPSEMVKECCIRGPPTT